MSVYMCVCVLLKGVVFSHKYETGDLELFNEKITKSRSKLRQSRHFLLVLSTKMLLQYASKVRLNNSFPPSLYNHII